MIIRFKNGGEAPVIPMNNFFEIYKYQSGGELPGQLGALAYASQKSDDVQLHPEMFDSASTSVHDSNYSSFFKSLANDTPKMNESEALTQFFNKIKKYSSTETKKSQPETGDTGSDKTDDTESEPPSDDVLDRVIQWNQNRSSSSSQSVPYASGPESTGPDEGAYEYILATNKNKKADSIVKLKNPTQLWKSRYKVDRTRNPTGRTDWSQEEFVRRLVQGYKAAGIKDERTINWLVAQDAFESGWGKAAASKYNNFGNLNAGNFKDVDVALRLQKNTSDNKWHFVYYLAHKSIEDYCNFKVNRFFKIDRYKKADLQHDAPEEWAVEIINGGYCQGERGRNSKYYKTWEAVAQTVERIRRKNRI